MTSFLPPHNPASFLLFTVTSTGLPRRLPRTVPLAAQGRSPARSSQRCRRGTAAAPGRPVAPRGGNFPAEFLASELRGCATYAGASRRGNWESNLLPLFSWDEPGAAPSKAFYCAGNPPERSGCAPLCALERSVGRARPAAPRSTGCGLGIIYELQPLFAQLMMHRRASPLSAAARAGQGCNWKPEPSPSPRGYFPFTSRCFIEGWGEALPVP
ncbi:uncharacterized protein LOC104916051 [Meleagris gallopavo]|uniref:uncharacterized protein LOC104916051 n=1 Tax=Meleagris gallopavo TaxID=9103 RepID=UPI000549DDD4|nr:uncharacterized protein LOC104916051 [Meleagris gallopavo]XP_031408892.1 uncharacterized protein LOC104916051 [Meleagris gallopavo]